MFRAALEDRHRHIRGHLVAVHPPRLIGREVVAEGLRGHAGLRHQGGELDVDEVARRGFVEQGGDDAGVVQRGEVAGIARIGHGLAQRLRRGQALRRLADHAGEDGAGILQPPFGIRPRGARAGQAAFGLRHVGARDLAHPEAFVGGLELAHQHLLVIRVEPHLLLVADDGDIGVHGIQQHLLFGRQQARALRQHLVLRPRGGGDGPPAAIERLGHRGIERRRVAVGGIRGAATQLRLGVDRPDAAAHLYGRAPAGQRLRHVLIDRAKLRAGGLQGRVVGIGQRQRLGQGLGRGGADSHHRGGSHQQHGEGETRRGHPGLSEAQPIL